MQSYRIDAEFHGIGRGWMFTLRSHRDGQKISAVRDSALYTHCGNIILADDAPRSVLLMASEAPGTEGEYKYWRPRADYMRMAQHASNQAWAAQANTSRDYNARYDDGSPAEYGRVGLLEIDHTGRCLFAVCDLRGAWTHEIDTRIRMTLDRARPKPAVAVAAE